MKNLLLIPLLLILIQPLSAQTKAHDFGTCFSKSNRKSIDNKMDNFLTRVSLETGCTKDSLTYTIDEYYTGYYSKSCRHLPKRITFNVRGEKRTYVHNGLSGVILHWLLGSWSLVSN